MRRWYLPFLSWAISGSILAAMGVWTLAREGHTRALVLGVAGIAFGLAVVVWAAVGAVRWRSRL